MGARARSEVRMPFTVTAGSSRIDAGTLLARQKMRLDALLLKYGALLFRGFGFSSIADFQWFVREFSQKDLLDYSGGVSPRLNLEKTGIYTSTEYPPEFSIPLHNEMSYSSVYPDHVYFYCHTAPKAGGQTTLGDSRRILKKIDQKITRLFKDKNVRYDRNLNSLAGSGYSWQDAFRTTDNSRVDEICRTRGAQHQWTGSGLRVSEVRPATALHPETGEEVWFNQADGFHVSNVLGGSCSKFGEEKPRLSSAFGDGTPICLLMLDQIRVAIRSETVQHEWQAGDILVLDNRLAAHGRMPFAGERKIAVAMT